MKTLLLNASYEPLRVISWQKAVVLTLLEKVDVLEIYTDDPVRSPTFSIEKPSVVRLKIYVNRPTNYLSFSRRNVYERDDHTCQYCNKKFRDSDLSFDHVIPKSKGGRTCWENIVTSCTKCNHKKGDKSLEEVGMFLSKPPYQPTLHRVLRRKKIPETWNFYMFMR